MNKNFKIIKKLIKKNYSIATAESCTGGLVGATITAVNGSSKIYKLGLITYSNLSKLKQLKVSNSIIKKYGEPVEFWMYDRQSIPTYIKLSQLENDTNELPRKF